MTTGWLLLVMSVHWASWIAGYPDRESCIAAAREFYQVKDVEIVCVPSGEAAKKQAEPHEH